MIRAWIFGLLAVAGCATTAPVSPPDQWFDRIGKQCGRAFEGRLVTSDPADTAFAGQRLVMHVRHCTPTEIRIPFQVGDDRSRTWVLTRTPTGVRLKHDHRHRDGASDILTMYGGDSANAGTDVRQEFPADAQSIALFTAQGRSVSNTNVWAVEVGDRIFAYELRRPPIPGGRFFRIEFDLSRPVQPPPPPWGS